MSSLYVLLPSGPLPGGREFSHVVSADGHHAGAPASAPAALLPAPSGAGGEVVAIVPASALSWHRFEWPRGVAPQSPRLRTVIEGVLEEGLLDEPEALHFAVEPGARPGATAWVAACDRAWLKSALQALEAAGRPASRIVPEVAPQSPPAVFAIGDADTGLVVARSEAGVRVLPLAASSQPVLADLPADADCLAEPGAAAAAEALLQRAPQIQSAPRRWLLAAAGSWDLAQFDLATSGRAQRWRRLAATASDLLHAPAWRPARWGAAALVLAQLAGLNAWAWRERQALAAQREAVQQVLTQTFPQVKVVIDAPVQMEREVAALRQATGTTSGRDLETLVGALAAAAPGRSVAGIDFANGELRARGLGWREPEVRAAAPALRSQGLDLRLDGEAVVLKPEETR